jgi:hypothetical protein
MGWNALPDAERDLVFRIGANVPQFTNRREVTAMLPEEAPPPFTTCAHS